MPSSSWLDFKLLGTFLTPSTILEIAGIGGLSNRGVDETKKKRTTKQCYQAQKHNISAAPIQDALVGQVGPWLGEG
jgi:hypothetical protein